MAEQTINPSHRQVAVSRAREPHTSVAARDPLARGSDLIHEKSPSTQHVRETLALGPARNQDNNQSVPLGQRQSAQDEISKLRIENTELLADLDQCRDALFALQPPGNVSDDQIQKEWEKILGAIDGLVYDTLVDLRDDALYHTWKKLRQHRKKRRAIRMFNGSDIRSWAQYASSNFLILSSVIQWILDENIFQKRYPLSMDSRDTTFIEEVTVCMKQSRNTRGQISIDRWMSETLMALTSRPSNEKTLQRRLKEINSRAAGILSDWVGGDFADFEVRLLKDVLEPSVRLHQSLRISSDRFDMVAADVTEELTPQQMIERWQLRSLDSWAIIKKESQIGNAMHGLHPSLVRYRDGQGSSVVLTKPVVAISPPGKARTYVRRVRKDDVRNDLPTHRLVDEPESRGARYSRKSNRQDSHKSGSEQGEPSSEDFDSESSSSRLSDHMSNYKPPPNCHFNLPDVQCSITPMSESLTDRQDCARDPRWESKSGGNSPQYPYVRNPPRTATSDAPRKETRDTSSRTNNLSRSADDDQQLQLNSPRPGPSSSSGMSKLFSKILGGSGS